MNQNNTYTYPSSITFHYYQDLEKACSFFEEVLKLKQVMDQGFAKVYQISETSFIGAVQKQEGSIHVKQAGGSLLSLNTCSVDQFYEHVQSFQLPYISEVKIIPSIPLKSFFFQDYEGYDYEIQEFIQEQDKKIFHMI